MEKIPIVRSASVVGGATLLSRVLGLVRDMLILSLFGSYVTDAFYAAWRFPNALRRLMGEGALSAAFIPVFNEYLKKRGRREVWELASAVMLCLLIASAVVTVVAIVLAPWIVRIMLRGWVADVEKFRLTVSLTRWLFPYLIFISLMALCMGILNSFGHFTMPALAPAVLNLVIILSTICIAPRMGPDPQNRIFAIAMGVLVGGAVQLAMQFPSLIKRGFTFIWGRGWYHPGLKRIIGLMIPAVGGLAVLQVNLIVDNLLASFLEEGSVTYLYAANRLIQFPMGIFGIGIATVVFPLMASYAVAGDFPRLKEALNYALRLVLFITIPASAGLMVLGRPIISLVFGHGAFLRDGSTDPTNWALLFYAVGLFAYGGVAVIIRCYYSFEDTRTPVRVGCVAVIANIVLDLILMGPLRHGGLALATSLASILNFALLVWLLRKKLGKLGLREVVISMVKIVVATALMATICYYTLCFISGRATGTDLVDKAVRALVPLCAGLISFPLLSFLLRARELDELWDAIRHRSP
jgi:putative peptidoglycan lipid II flippase